MVPNPGVWECWYPSWEAGLLAFAQLQSAATAASVLPMLRVQASHLRSRLPTWPSHTASDQAGPHAPLVWAQNASAGRKTKQNNVRLFKTEHRLWNEPTSRFGKRPMEMGNSLILRAVIHAVLPRGSPKPAGAKMSTESEGPSRPPNAPSRGRPRAFWRVRASA